MSTWQEIIGQEIRACRRLAILGAGSELCGDDAAGMLLIWRLQELLADQEQVLLLAGSTAPENFTGEIRRYQPDLLLLVDAAHIGGEIGRIAEIDLAEIRGMDFSTHMLPLDVMLRYLAQEVGCRIRILGIQPGQTEFASPACSRVKQSVEDLAQCIAQGLREREQ